MGVVDSTTDCLGLEAAGIIREAGPCVKDLAVGDRVFVFGAGCFSTGLIISQKYCAKIPDSLSFDEAATMPCVYSTVLHGLLDIGRLEAGQTVLIHSACGGVGLAAIQICLMVGAQIYCTVGSEEKKDHLASVFDIPRSRILYSRDSTFLDDVLAATNGRGVDLVLNSLSGDLLHASWRCVAEFGSMIEIGKRDFIGHGKLNLDVFEANRSYHGVDLGLLAERKPRGVTRYEMREREGEAEGTTRRTMLMVIMKGYWNRLSNFTNKVSSARFNRSNVLRRVMWRRRFDLCRKDSTSAKLSCPWTRSTRHRSNRNHISHDSG